ncbi:hypothetical protein AB0M95_39125 [Sphaerisporangium sp. NPDC051017]|uniref:hypothetical protein n=1 Tax=Sphaerisporangium sp. NPDC051017 TaxID=3154636 RepID=UPI003413A8F6
MNEIDLLTTIGANVPPLSDAARGRVRTMLLARAQATGPMTAPATYALTAPAGPPQPAGRRAAAPRRRRLALLALAGAAAAAAATALPLALGTPAYAVERLADGTVTVQIHQFLEPEKLQASLREAGVRAVVDYLPAGRSCRQPRGRQAAVPALLLERPVDGSGGVMFQVPPGRLKAGQTLIVEATFVRDDPARAGSIATSVVEGPVTPCAAVSGPAGDDPVKVVPIRPGEAHPGTPAGS